MACDPKVLASDASCFLCLSVMQLQTVKTLEICNWNPTPPPVKPTPVLIYDGSPFPFGPSWSISSLGTGQTSWKIYTSPSQFGAYSLLDTVPAAQLTYDFSGTGLIGFWIRIVGTDVSSAEVTNLSNVIQSWPRLDNQDGNDLFWEWDNSDPPFWAIYHNGVLDNVVDGSARDNSQGVGGAWTIQGVPNGDGSGTPVTPISNISNG